MMLVILGSLGFVHKAADFQARAEKKLSMKEMTNLQCFERCSLIVQQNPKFADEINTAHKLK